MLGLNSNSNWLFSDRDVSISVAGLDGVGKTTIINKILNEEITETYSTYGINHEIVNVDGLKLGLTDLGGKEPFRKSLWPSYISRSDALIFVVDATKEHQIQESKKWFIRSLKWIKKDSPILVLLNTWDKKVNQKEINTVSNLFKPSSRRQLIECFSVSPITGENLNKTIDWLANAIITNLVSTGISVEYFVAFLKTDNGILEARISTPSVIDDTEGMSPVIRYKFASGNESILEYMNLKGRQVVMAADNQTSCWLMTNVIDQNEEIKGANLLLKLLTEFIKEIQGLKEDRGANISESDLTSYLMKYLIDNQAFWSEKEFPMFEISYVENNS
ncbi:MAG: GTP-binding protein [Candidatus Heimdallarchaeota archaeon]|nr:GTP-binding protein [Candidatus Heimdallarchaeota archaeon]MCK4253695.1 GTP-binding protein [Candidatus Heimdallarchaeota archaeon]